MIDDRAWKEHICMEWHYIPLGSDGYLNQDRDDDDFLSKMQ